MSRSLPFVEIGAVWEIREKTQQKEGRMSGTFKVACIQNCASGDMEATLRRSREQVIRARDAGADLIALPEFFACLTVSKDRLETGAQPESNHPALVCYQ